MNNFVFEGDRPRDRSPFFRNGVSPVSLRFLTLLLLLNVGAGTHAFGGEGLLVEFDLALAMGKKPAGMAVSTGQVTVEGDFSYGTYGALHFRFNSAHYGADQGARRTAYALPPADGMSHHISARYDLQTVTISRDGVEVIRDWLDSQTTEIPSRPGPPVNFNTPLQNLKVTPFAVAPLLPEVRWQGVIGNSSALHSGPTM